MRELYEEQLDGQTVLRSSPSSSHEILCDRIQRRLDATLSPNSTLKLLPRRSPLQLSPKTKVRPDLALVKTSEQRPYLFVEILLPGDHTADTVLKKNLYQIFRLPRLWIVDPRYGNVEVYATGNYGFRLETILAHRELLSDPLLPAFQCSMKELFDEQ